MQHIVLIIHLIVAFLLIGFILMQHGKGSDIGASFGSGASQTVFGSQGSTSFLVKFIAILVAIFFISSLSLNYLIAQSIKQQQVANTPQILLQQDQKK
jgi:preprotein translocase subunit SecG